MEEETIYRQRVFKIGLVSVGLCLLIAYWYSTQGVAADCGYSKLLGDCVSLGEFHIYPPYAFYFWQQSEVLRKEIPQIMGSYAAFPYLGFIIGAGFTYVCAKNIKKETSHGSAAFATAKEIEETGLGSYEDKPSIEERKIWGLKYKTKIRKVKNSGVVVGVNPYNKHLMLHDGVEHILLIAPTRSGKGVNTIIPTGLVWRHSIFFFDVKEELWQATAGYRQKVLKQKVMKFAPLVSDGSSARWNPLAEINFRTAEEISDVAMIVGIMVRPDGEKTGGGDSAFWDNSAAALITGVIMHLMYKHYQEKLRLPCPTDIMSFLSSPDMDLKELFIYMKNYPHISPEEFLELPDEQGIPRKNPLKEIYGEYVQNLRPFARFFKGKTIKKLEDVKREILELMKEEEIDWEADEDSVSPFHILLTHPKVAECAANMLNGAEQTRASIMQTAQTALALYQNPVIQKNTEVSDFCIKDLLSPKNTVSLYLCMHSNEVQTLKPLSRLLINTMLHKLVRDIKFDTSGGAEMKQRLLLMLDEFPQLGNLKSMELALAVCAGYGIKVCIVAQDVNQINKEYTKDNSIASNCHVHIYFTPNLDSGSATAESISKNLGKKTITTVSHSDGGGLGKGSNSESFTGRELMTPDEVSHMSSEKELVFVAGHRPIYGNKLRYYLQPFFTKRLSMYQEIYVMEHGYEKECSKFTMNGKHDCERCVREYKIPQGKVAIPCPTYPLYSDSVTKVLSYEDLFEVNAGGKLEREEKARAVRLEKEYEERKAAKEKAKKNKIVLRKEKEAQKSDENINSREGNPENPGITELDEQNQDGKENTENARTVGEYLGGEIGKGAAEKMQSKLEEIKIARKIMSKFYLNKGNTEITLFGESLTAIKQYEESWEEYISEDGK